MQALDRDPAVGAEALLTRSREQELRDVLAEQQRLAARRGRPVGRPVAGTWRAERSMAVDCWVARELAGRSRPEIALEQAACAARVDEAVLAIHRVLDEREHPGLHALRSEACPFTDLT